MSTDTKRPWTPGPWEWANLYGAFYELAHFSPSETFPNGLPKYSVICDDGSCAGEYSQTISPSSANARLIAAAPELAEYAIGEEGWSEICALGDDDDPWPFIDLHFPRIAVRFPADPRADWGMDDVYESIRTHLSDLRRAALAKARGEEATR